MAVITCTAALACFQTVSSLLPLQQQTLQAVQVAEQPAEQQCLGVWIEATNYSSDDAHDDATASTAEAQRNHSKSWQLYCAVSAVKPEA